MPKIFKTIPLERVYKTPLPINENKKKNMEELLQFVPPVNHQYFKSVNGHRNVENNGPLQQYYAKSVSYYSSYQIYN